MPPCVHTFYQKAHLMPVFPPPIEANRFCGDSLPPVSFSFPPMKGRKVLRNTEIMQRNVCVRVAGRGDYGSAEVPSSIVGRTWLDSAAVESSAAACPSQAGTLPCLLSLVAVSWPPLPAAPSPPYQIPMAAPKSCHRTCNVLPQMQDFQQQAISSMNINATPRQSPPVQK